MSRHRCCRRKCCKPVCGCEKDYGYGCGTGCCNFPQLIILILILLQFSCKGIVKPADPCNLNQPVLAKGIDKGIIFIIALYYLSCCNPCGKRY